MKGDLTVIELLNEILTAELSAINQFFVHSKMLGDWGYAKLSLKKRQGAIEATRHADWIVARILDLEGVPNLQEATALRVGQKPIEVHQVDLELEIEAVHRFNRGIAVSARGGDNATRRLLESILVTKEQSVLWLERQLKLVDEAGGENYLAIAFAPVR